MKETAQAWALLGIDVSTSPPRIVGVDIFSEESPTLTGSSRTMVVAVGYGRSYEEGIAHLRRILSEPYYSWTLPLLSRRACQSLAVAP